MSTYRVGQPYAAGRKIWPAVARYSYRDQGHELALFLSGVTGSQVADLCRGQVELALVADEQEIVLCSRFGGTIPWSHAQPFRWNLEPPADRGVPADPGLTPGFHARIGVALVEADGGLVCALRSVFLSPAFTSALNAAVRAQADSPTRTLPAAWSAAKLFRLDPGPMPPGAEPSAEDHRCDS